MEEINESAFYLRYEQGRYFASEEPTINSILARIRKTLKESEIEDLLNRTARKTITDGSGLFHVEHDVSLPEHLPDDKNLPVLGIVSMYARTIDVESLITTKGVNKPRVRQNLIFLLVPETVVVKRDSMLPELFQNEVNDAQNILQHIKTIASQVKAMRTLINKPQSYGVNPARLQQDYAFKKRVSERDQALVTAISGIYNSLYYSSTAGNIARKEIKTAGGEGGFPFFNLIQEKLIKDNELLTSQNTTQADLINLSNLFFERADNISLEKVRENFLCNRNWPVLENQVVLDQIIRVGVQKGTWCVFRMGEGDNLKPAEFYHRENEIPMAVSLSEPGFGMVTNQGAKQRGWAAVHEVRPEELRDDVIYTIAQNGITTLREVSNNIAEKHGEVPPQDLEEAIATLVKNDKLFVFRGTPDQEQKPELIHGPGAALYTPQQDDVFVTPAKAAERGWITARRRSFNLNGKEGAQKVLPLLRRLGSLYNRGAKSTIENLDLVDLELPEGGMLRIQLTDVPPESMKALGELFEVMHGIARKGEDTEVYLDIEDPDQDCLLVRELTKDRG